MEVPVQEVSLEEIKSAKKKMRLGRAFGLLEISVKMINANGKIEIDVMMKVCQRVLDGKRMLDDWKTSVVVPIYQGKRRYDKLRCI